MPLTFEEEQRWKQEQPKTYAFERMLHHATLYHFSQQTAEKLLQLYEERNGPFDPDKSTCPGCRGLGHYQIIIDQRIYPACHLCKGTGQVEQGGLQ